MRKFLVVAALLMHAPAALAQIPHDTVRGITRFAFDSTGLALSGSPRNGMPLRDYGRRAAVIGDELGHFDVVIDGQTVVRNLHFSFRLDDADPLFEADHVAASVTRMPEGLTVVYSHPAFTVREHVLVPLNEPGAIVLLDVQSTQPLDVLVRMDGTTSPHVFVGAPSTAHGPLSLRFDPGIARRDFMPIIIAGGSSADSIAANYLRLFRDVRRHWREKVIHYRDARGDLLATEMPDARIDQALEWAKVNLDQQITDPFAVAAMSHVGQFDLARTELRELAQQNGRASFDQVASWILASFEYWTASRDDAFLRATWPELRRSFDRNAAQDTLRSHSDGVWAAALEGIQQMARAVDDDATAARAARLASAVHTRMENAWQAGGGVYAPDIEPLSAMALAMLDAERSGSMLRVLASSRGTADWGARADNGAVMPATTGFLSLAHYRHHRAWSGFDLIRDAARMMLDFERGRAQQALSGALYQALDVPAAETRSGSPMLITAFTKGLAGWHADAPHRAAALEPHLPAGWSSLVVSGLRLARDRIDATITRERGLYTIALRRATAGPPLSIRVAPALPLGARIERIVVDDADVEVQVEESAHDVHGVAEVALARDVQVEFHYEGGMEIVAPAERIEIGDASTNLRVIDFRREGRDYVVVAEGVAGMKYGIQLQAETRIRTAAGADSFEQNEQRLLVRVTMPAGSGFSRKTVRLRP